MTETPAHDPAPAPAPTTTPRATPPGLTQSWRAPLLAYAATVAASLLLAVLTIVSLSSSSAGGDASEASDAVDGLFAFVALPFQLAAMALGGRIGVGDENYSLSLRGLPLLLSAIYIFVALRVASRAERQTPSTNRSARALTSGAAALFAVIVVAALTRIFALRSDGESIYALSFSLVLGTFVLTFVADFLGRELVTAALPAHLFVWRRALMVWLAHLALWFAVALPVLFVVMWVQEGFRAALSLPLWGPTAVLWAYTVGHLSSVGTLGVNTFAWSGDGFLVPLSLIGGALVAALAASVLWHLRSARSVEELARPASWIQLPAVFAAGGLVITVLSSVSVGGAGFGTSGSVSFGPAIWTFIVLGIWGGIIEGLTRTLAPRIAPALPQTLTARLRGPAVAEGTSPVTPEPLTPEQARKVRRIALVGGTAVALVVGAFVAVSVANSILYSPEKVAQNYLDAVADGDVDTALESMPNDQDLSMTLMTDEIYAAATDRPSSYSLGEVTDYFGATSVDVEAKGGVGGDGSLTLEEGDKKFGLFNQWKVTEGLTSTLSIATTSSSGVSVNGVEVETTDDYGSYAVLPGSYNVDPFAGNEWVEAGASPVKVALGDYASAEMTEPQPSAAFKEQVDSAMADWLGACMDSTELEPDGCPQSGYAYGDVRNVSWELTTPPTIDYSYFDPTFPMSLSTSDGEATATYEADDSYGYGPKEWTKETEESSIYFSVTVNEDGNGLSVDFES